MNQSGQTPLQSTSTQAPVVPEGRLVIYRGAEHVTTVSLESSTLIVGRSSQVQINLNHKTLSRRHAEFTWEPEQGWMVRDLNSRNGTKVNGNALQEGRWRLRHGDKVQVGHFLMHFLLDDDDACMDREAMTYLQDPVGRTISTLSDLEPPYVKSEHLRRLLEFGEQLASCTDSSSRMRVLCELLTNRHFRGKAAAILRLQQRQPEMPPHWLWPSDARSSSSSFRDDLSLSSSVLRAVVARRDAVVGTGTPTEGLQNQVALTVGPTSTCAVVACPLIERKDHVDVLYVSFPPQCATGEWMWLTYLAGRLWAQAEGTAEKARRSERLAAVEEQLERARAVQAKLGPRDGTYGCLEVRSYFAPCQWVAGDYADTIALSNGCVLLVVADVAGKGLQASLLAATLRGIVQTYLSLASDLEGLMNCLNNRLHEDLPEGRFITLVAVLIDPSTGELQTANAGHPGAVVIQPNGGHRWLNCIGAMPLRVGTEPIRTTTDRLEPGEILALFSDGLHELCDAQGHYLMLADFAQLVDECFGAQPDASVSDMLQALIARVYALDCNRPARDDRTVLIARRHA